MISTTISEFANKSHVQNQLVKTLFTVAAAATGTDSNTVLVASASTFLSDGVLPGDLVTNSTDGSTATVVSVDSETQITTGGLSGGGDDTFQATDVIAIDPPSSGTEFRVVVYGANDKFLLREVWGNTDGSSDPVLSFYIDDVLVGEGLLPADLFSIDPDLRQGRKGERLVIVMDVDTAPLSRLNVSYQAY